MASRTHMVRPRAKVDRPIWERWTFSVYMQVGLTDTWEWIEFTLTCQAGCFLKDFRELSIPGLPVWDPESTSMRRERIYRGTIHPDDVMAEVAD